MKAEEEFKWEKAGLSICPTSVLTFVGDPQPQRLT